MNALKPMALKNSKMNWFILLAIAGLIGLIGAGWWLGRVKSNEEGVFEGARAYENVLYQVSLGPRTPGSEGHAKIIEWMVTELKGAGWKVEVQRSTFQGHLVQNVIAKKGSGHPWTILGAHYDTRLAADQDPDLNRRTTPVPGANDGASGVAVLLELAREMKVPSGQIWLVFFDAEDNGDLQGMGWILGSQAFVEKLTEKPDRAVIVDMIGDSDLNIYLEGNSSKEIAFQIWEKAAELGYANQFIPRTKFHMIDDHTPFLRAGIPAVDIIDFDYPYWHTTEDTADKVSAQSLEAVGNTLMAWLK